MPTPAALLPIAVEAVDRASRMVRDRPHGHVTMKGDRDPASEVDYAVEREIRAFLLDQAPTVGFLGEEYGKSGDTASQMYWALDPVDGTMNFIHGIPLCGVSLGLVLGGRSALGVIGLPFLHYHYSAILGHGAYRGETRLRASMPNGLSDAIVALGDYAVGEGSEERNTERLRVTERLAGTVGRVRMFGSAAVDLAWVAEGRLAASIMLANKPWDTIAGVLLAREAGADVLDREGRQHTLDSDSTVAASPALSSDLVRLLRADVSH